jgi:hypothetical protein
MKQLRPTEIADMSPESAANRDRYLDLMRRYNKLGDTLPSALADPQRRELDVMLRRMQWTQGTPIRARGEGRRNRIAYSSLKQAI